MVVCQQHPHSSTEQCAFYKGQKCESSYNIQNGQYLINAVLYWIIAKQMYFHIGMR